MENVEDYNMPDKYRMIRFICLRALTCACIVNSFVSDHVS